MSVNTICTSCAGTGDVCFVLPAGSGDFDSFEACEEYCRACGGTGLLVEPDETDPRQWLAAVKLRDRALADRAAQIKARTGAIIARVLGGLR